MLLNFNNFYLSSSLAFFYASQLLFLFPFYKIFNRKDDNTLNKIINVLILLLFFKINEGIIRAHTHLYATVIEEDENNPHHIK